MSTLAREFAAWYRPDFLERDVELNPVAGADDVVLGLGALAVDAHAVFTKKLPHVADWELLLEEILKLFGCFILRQNDFAHDLTER